MWERVVGGEGAEEGAGLVHVGVVLPLAALPRQPHLRHARTLLQGGLQRPVDVYVVVVHLQALTSSAGESRGQKEVGENLAKNHGNLEEKRLGAQRIPKQGSHSTTRRTRNKLGRICSTLTHTDEHACTPGSSGEPGNVRHPKTTLRSLGGSNILNQLPSIARKSGWRAPVGARQERGAVSAPRKRFQLINRYCAMVVVGSQRRHFAETAFVVKVSRDWRCGVWM